MSLSLKSFFRSLQRVWEPSPGQKGALGENEIYHAILKEIKRGIYGYCLHNLYLPKKDGSTSEVDILFISVKGLFLIESKNYVGWIFGDDRRKEWTVSLYGGKTWFGGRTSKKFKFYNPVWQNKTHEKVLRQLIGRDVPIFPLVVFSDRGDLMNLRYDASSVQIIHTSQLRSFFSYMRAEYPDALTEHEVCKLYEQLLPYTQAGEKERQAHIAQIYEQRFNPQKCPWCGGSLTIRTAKKGLHPGQQFYGCVNYPRCTYTRNFE